MTLASPYSSEDRARARSVVRSLSGLAEKQHKALERGERLSEEDEQAIMRLTNTHDPSQRIEVLYGMSEAFQEQHLDRLYPLAADEFKAFCEVMHPEEPPESAWHIFLTDTLQDIENDVKKSRFILNCPPGHAKPLHVDTPVLMATGEYKRLGDIVPGDWLIAGSGAPRRVTHVHEQGTLPILQIETRQGRRILSAPDHTFFANGNWKEAKNLNPGDRLDIPSYHETVWEDAEVNRAEVRLAAWWCAYGSVAFPRSKSKSGTTLANIQMWFPIHRKEAYSEIIRENNLDIPVYLVEGGFRPTPGAVARIGSRKYGALIERFKMRRPGYDRVIPDFVFRAPSEYVRDFLSIFLSERAECPKRYKEPRLLVYARSEALLIGLQRLLSRFAIPSSVVRPPEGFDGRTRLMIDRVGIAAMKAAGVVYDGAFNDRIAGIKPQALPIVQDYVLRVTRASTGECRCLTVDQEHTFTADGVVVHNSTYASRDYVVWRMGRNPNLQVIGGGHGQTFVENEFSYKNRTAIRSPAFQRVFPGVKVDDKKSAKGQWAIAGKKGQYVAKGVGQGVHGFRANFICVDDPYAKIEDAESPAYRERVKTWFLTDLGTRLLPRGKLFVIMTRFHEEDLTGTLIELNKSYTEDRKYLLIDAPAICYNEETDVLGRSVGELLWDYYSYQDIIDKKIDLKFQRFMLVYQQLADAASEDSITGKFQYYSVRPDRSDQALSEAREKGQINPETGRPEVDRGDFWRRIVVSVDTATKDNARADWTVIQVWGETVDRKHYLLDQKRVKVEFTDLITEIERMANTYGASQILVEDKGNGAAYIQARQPAEGRRLAPCPIVPIKTPSNQGKEFRFNEVTPMISAGEVYLPQNASWIELFLKEIGQFPEGNKDDQVDAMTQYLRWAKSHNKRYGTRKVGSMG